MSDAAEPRYRRFTLSDRIEHWVQVFAFTGLAITGLIQLGSDKWVPQAVITVFGGINTTRVIHRSLGIVVLIATAYHLGTAGYRFLVTRTGKHMIPGLGDARAAWHAIAYNLGIRDEPPYEGRFTFAEKMEYWSIIWGTMLMAATGLMMWNPVATTSILPGEFIPAAKAAHGGEAILAVLAIIVWHAYFVHLRHFNRSMLTGDLGEEEMEEEHAAELDAIMAGEDDDSVPADVVRRRMRWFVPIYAAIVLVGTVFIVLFLTYQEITIKTVPPPAAQVEIYAPYVPGVGTPVVGAAPSAATPQASNEQ